MLKNISIYDSFSDIIKLMELHKFNIFKINSYKNALRFIKKTDLDLTTLSIEELMNIKGFGKSIAFNIKEISETGKLEILEELKKGTPIGVVEMLKINGLGPQKIKMLWDQLKIDSIDKLFNACKTKKLSKIKGFGEKTQELIIKEIEFLKQHKNTFLYSIASFFANILIENIKKDFSDILISMTGDLRRKNEIINEIEILVGFNNKIERDKIINYLDYNELLIKNSEQDSPNIWKGFLFHKNIEVSIYIHDKKEFYKYLILTTGSKQHLDLEFDNKNTLRKLINNQLPINENQFYESNNLTFIPQELREGSNEIKLAQKNLIPKLIEVADIKGIIHCHTKYSDGTNSLLEMTEYCMKKGFKYLGVTDHSKTAVYAGGMTLDKIEHQHKEIDKINKIFKPFKVFKGLESDILKDGSLDYDDEILQKFDFIIGSIHSGFKMTKDEATQRLIKAIQNPFLTILGHPTGRLLLKRNGYPIDHKAIIDECAKNKVIIEINSNPNRLDLDWRWINYAINKKILLSINPDAHSIIGVDDIQYGVAIARKGGATKDNIFTTFDLQQIEEFFIKEDR
ncbi:MAG: DNA polymerase/3'-5' exonuclease PolX [Bacteroidetes bacterium]|nr:DNA polymerase/3'-5' exonuclease PolX [Bacteroidota bacterium]